MNVRLLWSAGVAKSRANPKKFRVYGTLNIHGLRENMRNVPGRGNSSEKGAGADVLRQRALQR
jgi:hypothetical protein